MHELSWDWGEQREQEEELARLGWELRGSSPISPSRLRRGRIMWRVSPSPHLHSLPDTGGGGGG